MSCVKALKMKGKNQNRPGFFLDRDGVINELVYYPEQGLVDTPCRVKDFHILPGVAAAVRKIKKAGFKVVVITNQPGIAKGRFTARELERINKKMLSYFQAEKAGIDGLYQCLHHPEGTRYGARELIRKCGCRKPSPGLFNKAASELGIDLKKSFFVGDDLTDMEAGKRAGLKTVFLGSIRCYQCRYMKKRGIRPDFVYNNLADFARRLSWQAFRK